MSPYLTYYIYLSCHPTLKEDRLLDKQEGSRSPEAFLKIFTRSRPVLAAQKSWGIFTRVAGLRTKYDSSAF